MKMLCLKDGTKEFVFEHEKADFLYRILDDRLGEEIAELFFDILFDCEEDVADRYYETIGKQYTLCESTLELIMDQIKLLAPSPDWRNHPQIKTIIENCETFHKNINDIVHTHL